MKHTAVLIFPNQLFEHHPALTHKSMVFLIEHPRFFTEFHFHKQKLILHRASMKGYQKFLEEKGHRVFYLEFSDKSEFELLLKKNEVSLLECTTLDDHRLEQGLNKMCEIHDIRLRIHESPGFLADRQWLAHILPDQDHYLMNSFYIAQRKRLNILMHGPKPVGGRWSFDAENRQKLSKNIQTPEIFHAKKDSNLKEAHNYITNHFSHNPGLADDFIWATNHAQAKKALHDFLEHRLAYFGPYQDAIDPQKHFLFHSLLSSSLNIGLLTPAYVIQTTLEFTKEHRTPLNSLEGFIRQIIGWREFVRGIYLVKGEYQRESNFFGHSRTLPSSFWTGTTGIDPVDTTIKKITHTAYAHHIERLMILGNFMLLAHIDPNQAYRWFMELFIDAYDWVMVPNVYGMSQYADGGLMITKPYFSGSHYIRKMSTYTNGPWCQIWDALYWHFVFKNRKIITSNARLAAMGFYLKRMNPTVLKNYNNLAVEFLNTF